MGTQLIRHNVTHAFAQREPLTVLHFADKFTFQTMYQVPFLAPVIGDVAWGIFHDAEAEAGQLEGLPISCAGCAGVLGFGDEGPVDGLEWDGWHGW